MEKVDCPIRGKKYDCRQCHFYQKEYTTEYACIEVAKLAHLNEITQNIKLLVNSSEQHRETDVQMIKSMTMGRGPTRELKQLIGIKEAAE